MSKNKITKLVGALACAPSLLVGCNNKPTPKPAPSQFEVMLNNSRKIVMEHTATGNYETATKEQILNQLKAETIHGKVDEKNETYYFTDLDYKDGDPAKWPCGTHVMRALQIAVVGAKRGDNDLLEIAHKLWSYYICNDFHNKNWWWESIGIPRDSSDLCLFVYNLSTPKEQKRSLDIIRHGSFYFTSSTRSATGCNLYDYAHITLKSSILAQDGEELKSVNQYLLPGIAKDKEEGFQSDGAFFQHGRMIQSGSYGRQGMIRLAKIAATFADTNVDAFPPEKLEIILNSIVNGIKYLTHKGSFNYNVLGRTYSRPTALRIDGGTTDLGNLDDLSCFLALKNLPHHDELVELLDNLKNNKPTFTGIRYFPSSSLIAMNLDGIYMSYRGGGITNKAKQTVNMEGINGENHLAYNLSYGTNTCVMETGKEYINMPAIWEYDSLPGTTALTEDDKALKTDHGPNVFNGRKLEGIFALGNPTIHNQNKDDPNIVINMGQTVHEGIKYTVTCFATKDGMVLLGAGLDAAGKPLHTTIEQCACENEPIRSEDEKVVQRGNVVYRSLTSNKFTIEYGSKEGNWHRNNDAYDLKAEEKVLKISYPNVTSYAYSIQPVSHINNIFKVAVNNEKCQVIELPDGEHLVAAFYKANSFEYEGKTYTGGLPGTMHLYAKQK